MVITMEEKSICLKCGGFYPPREKDGTSCVWCSIFDKMLKSPSGGDGLQEELEEEEDPFFSS
jgi:hypothetical protein